MFNQPQYSKKVNEKTGVMETCYTFMIEWDEEDDPFITYIADSSSEISVEVLLEKLDNNEEWEEFIGEFLESSAKFFSKSYSVQNLKKIIKHKIEGNIEEKYPLNVYMYPKKIQIVNGTFWVIWEYMTESLVIDIPVLNESSDELEKNESKELEELNSNDINHSTDDTFELDNPMKMFDKQKVKEARMKAKLAAYKAEYHMKQYYEKYGDSVSESDSENDSDVEEDEK